MSSWRQHTVLGLKTLQAAHDAAIFALNSPPRSVRENEAKKTAVDAVLKTLLASQEAIEQNIETIDS